MAETFSVIDEVKRAAGTTVGALFRQRAIISPDRPAVEWDGHTLTFQELNARVNRLANVLSSQSIERGDRLAIVSENRREYLEIELAAAKLGIIVACQNWRQSPEELKYCVSLVAPKLIFMSPRFREAVFNLQLEETPTICLGEEYETLLENSVDREPEIAAQAEDGLIILYTSGTTGLPKAAVISHRAEIARSMVNRADGSLFPDGAVVAWAPCFHMSSTDKILGAAMQGTLSILLDGFNPEKIVEIIGRQRLGHLTLVPATIGRVIAELKRTGIKPKGIEVIGGMADLVPLDEIAEITSLLQAPFRNSFGSTETGSSPASCGRIPIGVNPDNLSKQQNSYCELRLVDEDDNEVAIGEVGEVTMRGPTLFSGYWDAPEATAEAFRGGWYHMGDLMVRNADGSVDFVDRRKYLIKSGGENIYPAEIERCLLSSPKIADAAVVRKPDQKWGEIPVVFVVRKDESLIEQDVIELCRGRIANYKLPKEVRFVTEEQVPRTANGKIKRAELEAML